MRKYRTGLEGGLESGFLFHPPGVYRAGGHAGPFLAPQAVNSGPDFGRPFGNCDWAMEMEVWSFALEKEDDVQG